MPETTPQIEFEGTKGFSSGIWTVGGGIDIPQDAMMDCEDWDIEEDGDLATRNGVSRWVTSRIGGTYSPGGNAVVTGTTTATCASASFVTQGIDGSGWYFFFNPGGGNVYVAIASATATVLTLATAAANGTYGTWGVVYAGKVRGLHRHYVSTDATSKSSLLAYGKRITKMTDAGTETLLDATRTADLDTNIVEIADISYISNGADLPLRYDVSAGIQNASSYLTQPLNPPGFLFSSQAVPSKTLTAGYSGFTIGTSGGGTNIWYHDSKTLKGSSAGSYGPSTATLGAFTYNKLIVRDSGRVGVSPLGDLPTTSTRYAVNNSVPWFFVPDAAASQYSAGTFTSNGTTTVTLSATYIATTNISIGDVFYPLNDTEGDFYFITATPTNTTITVDRAVATATAKNFIVFRNRLAYDGTRTVQLTVCDPTYTSFYPGGTAVASGSGLSFQTDQNAAALTINDGDLLLVFPDTSYTIAGITVVKGAADSWGSGFTQVTLTAASGASNAWITGLGLEDSYRLFESTSNVGQGLWQFSGDNSTFSNALAPGGVAAINDTTVIVKVANASAGTWTAGSGKTVYARPDSSKWPQYRTAVCYTNASATLENLRSHSGALPPTKKFCLISGAGPSATVGYELFKSTDNANFVETTTVLGNKSTTLGIPGVCVTDSRANISGTAYAQFLQAMPIYRFGIQHLGRFFVMNVKERDGSASYPLQVRYSQPEQPEQFDPLSFYTIGSLGGEGAIVGGFILNRQMYILKDNSLWILNGDIPESLEPIVIDRSVGCANWKTIAIGFNDVYWLSNDGVYRFNGVQPALISRPIAETIRGLSAAQKQTACGVWRERRYWLTLPDKSGNEALTRTWIYDPIKNAWTKHSYGAWTWHRNDTQHDGGELLFTYRYSTNITYGSYIQRADDNTAISDDFQNAGAVQALAPYVVPKRFDGRGTIWADKDWKLADLILTTQDAGVVTPGLSYDPGGGSWTVVV